MHWRMILDKSTAMKATILLAMFFAAVGRMAAGPLRVDQPAAAAAQSQTTIPLSDEDFNCNEKVVGSAYIPVDSWIYPEVLRLFSLGYVPTAYLNLRPWTRASLSNMLEDTEERLEDSEGEPGESEAEGIFDSLKRELREETDDPCKIKHGSVHVDSTYSVIRGISGTPLRDSFHLGSTIVNDYGRPFATGVNNYTGASGYASAGRFLLYVRGEFQGAPSTAGYSAALASQLAAADLTTDYFSPSCWLNNTGCVPMPTRVGDDTPRADSDGGAHTLAGGLCLRAVFESRDLVRKTGFLAESRHGRRDVLLEQRGEYLLVPDQSHRAADHPSCFTDSRAHTLRVYGRIAERTQLSKRSLGAC